ncbi:MAG: glycerophosphodiester phosphodiesterase family protein [Actinomycetota bacterium]|nr:glycerophosphodiester phosphodiesterase family protein [Actinomycetota bacterium]MDK1038664.1 glycerophosphodiester phosphodiesterase family protein [Actinomycetota bacterium]MDK1096649.1 glycerophosphodiester phosphodiesterase family protein [Actinomycetota bacterium]MDK1291417.1 glycerophosphodiester phosphodiesterase family protein [Actinomycetota bacterium]
MQIEPGSVGRSEEWVLSHQDGVTKLILTHSLPDPGVEDWAEYFGGLYRGCTLFVATLELDLHFSADGEVIVWHDPVIDPEKCGLRAGAPPDDPATSKDALAVRALTTDQLRWIRCDRNPDPDQDSNPTALAGDDYGIVTFGALIEFVAQYASAEVKSVSQREGAAVVAFNAETKRKVGDPEAIGDSFDGKNVGLFEIRLLAVIDEFGIRDRVTVQSFDFRSLQAIHRSDSGIRLATLTAGDANPAGHAALGASIWSPKVSSISERRMAEAREAGLLIIPWAYRATAAWHPGRCHTD